MIWRDQRAARRRCRRYIEWWRPIDRKSLGRDEKRLERKAKWKLASIENEVELLSAVNELTEKKSGVKGGRTVFRCSRRRNSWNRFAARRECDARKMRQRRTSSVIEVEVVDRFWLTGLNPYLRRTESIIWGRLAVGMVERRTRGMWIGSACWGAARAQGGRRRRRKKGSIVGQRGNAKGRL